MNFDAKEIFSIRKFKTGTHSARLGKVALASAAVLAVGLGSTAVSADETTTVVAPEVAVVTTANPATNLETAQSAPSQANLDAQAQSGTNTGAIVTPVETPEVSQAVSDAKEAGVTVTETSSVTYDTLAEAQADAAKQVVAIENAETEKVANTEAIAKAEATNKQIDADNEAEEKRVAEVNKAGQAAVDQRNQLNEQAVKDRNAKALATWEENKKAIIATDEKAMQGYEERKAANEAANKAGQEAVDQRNDEGQAKAEAQNAVEKQRADAENAKNKKAFDEAMALYNAKLAEIEAAKKALTAHTEQAPTKVSLEMEGRETQLDYNVSLSSGKYEAKFTLDNKTGKFTINTFLDDGKKPLLGDTYIDGHLNYKTSYNADKDQTTTVVTGITYDTVRYVAHRANTAVNKNIGITYYDPSGATLYSRRHNGSSSWSAAINKTYNFSKNIVLTPGQTSDYFQVVRLFDDWILDSRSVIQARFVNTNPVAPSVPTDPMVRPTEPTYVTPKVVNFTPEKFTPTPFTETPPVPSELPNRPELENFTPESYVPVTPVYKPHVDVPDVKDITVSVHPLFVKQSPANVKAVVNADGENTNGTLVPKGSTQTWTLTNSALKAGRQVVTSYVMSDPLPSGFVLDREATASKNTAWMMVYDESGKVGLQATEATLAMLNANRDQDVAVPVAYLVGTPINDGGTYKNTFDTVIKTPNGEYKVVSNTPVIYTPGNDPKTPRKTPKGDNPTPNDNLIQPEKDVIDAAGKSIDGKSVLPNTVLNYVAKQDFDQYKGMSASQSSIAKGFMYADDYLDEAIDGKSLVVNSITAANGDDVTKLLTKYYVLSQDSLSEALQELVKTSGISPVGEFYLWVAKDPQAFYEAYVQKGLDITYNLSFKIKESFTEGDITNQTFQVDFGNGYYGNVVKNMLPLVSIHKDVLDEDGKSIDGGIVKLGDKVTYKLEGWVVPAGRGYDINSYVFVDMLQHTHDEFKDVVFKAKIDFTLADGTEIKSGDDLSKYVETVYNAETGRLESRFKADFLAQITRDVAFGADSFVSVVRIKDGEVVNSYDLIINDYRVLSNKVMTTTLKPADPQTPPTPEVPKAVLPSTGEASSLLSILGGVILSGLGFVGIRKRKEN